MVLAYKPAIPWPDVAQFFMGPLRLSKINGKPAPSKHSPHLAAMFSAHTRISPSTCIQKRNKSVRVSLKPTCNSQQRTVSLKVDYAVPCI